MKAHFQPILFFGSFIFASACFIEAGSDSSTNRFGFSGREIFPIDSQIGNLRSADLDNDGFNDLVVVNNARSKINLLYNQSGKPEAEKTRPELNEWQLNELPPDSRFRIDAIASEKRIASLVVTDLNGDDRPDIAYFGEPPRELVLQYNEGNQGWGNVKRWPINNGNLTPNGLVHGDLNGDDRTDLALLGEESIYLFYQDENRLLGEPEQLPFSGAVKALQVLDINADRRDDLLLVNWDNFNPFRFRLQDAQGELGAEIHFTLSAIRSYWADDLDGNDQTEFITIALNSGRAQLARFTRQEATPLTGDLLHGQFQVLPLTKTSKNRRGTVWADLNGDDLQDLLVAQPDSGELTAYLQEKAPGKLGPAKVFPSLTGISEFAVEDWDEDGRPEIFLLSDEERVAGVTRLDANGRIGFPDILSMNGRPLALTAGRLYSESKPVLALIYDQEGRRHLQIRTADGEVRNRPLEESFKSNPNSLSIHDVNQDGLQDLIVLIPYAKIKILLQQEEGEFEELDLSPPGGGGSFAEPWMSMADVDGDGKAEMLLAQQNFLRAVVLERGTSAAGAENESSNWSFQIKEQINGAAGNSKIVGATVLTPDEAAPDSTGSLFLMDAERKALTLCERDEAGVWKVVRNIPLPVSGFNRLQPVGLGSDGENSVAFMGLRSVAWLKLAGKTWEFTELAGYETPIEDGYLRDVISGDLNGDSKKELVFLETAKNHLEIVTYNPPRQLTGAIHWKVFESHTFRNRRSGMPEPREALIAELTGDDKNDLAILVHDRVLVYPQE